MFFGMEQMNVLNAASEFERVMQFYTSLAAHDPDGALGLQTKFTETVELIQASTIKNRPVVKKELSEEDIELRKKVQEQEEDIKLLAEATGHCLKESGLGGVGLLRERTTEEWTKAPKDLMAATQMVMASLATNHRKRKHEDDNFDRMLQKAGLSGAGNMFLSANVEPAVAPAATLVMASSAKPILPMSKTGVDDFAAQLRKQQAINMSNKANNLKNEKINEQKAKLLRLLQPLHKSNIKPNIFFDVLSITKGVLGMAFLNANIDVYQTIYTTKKKNNAESMTITLKDALCHHTGVEDKFDYFMFMNKIGHENMLHYAEKVFADLCEKDENQKKIREKQFAYNNIVWRIISGILYKDRKYIDKWFQQNIGTGNFNFDVSKDNKKGHDIDNIPNGVNGLRLNHEGICNVVMTAYNLFKNISLTTLWALQKIPAKNKCTVHLDEKYGVYAYYGWFFVVFPNVVNDLVNSQIRGCFAHGYNRQFICLDFNYKTFSVQFCTPFFLKTKDEKAENFVATFFSKTEKIMDTLTTAKYVFSAALYET